MRSITKALTMTAAVGLAGLALTGCGGKEGSAEQGTPPPYPRAWKPAREYASAWEHFQALKQEAGGGQQLDWDDLPDWSGVWTRVTGNNTGFVWNPHAGPNVELGPPYALHDAQLTPAYQARYEKKVADIKRGVEWDQLSYCLPPGFPRWMTEPFLREFVLRPNQVWLINEMVNDIRRIYTDGRPHTDPSEEGPLWNGDSIGFWDGDTLVIHTQQLRAGQYQRGQPDYSDKVQTVERWRKVGPKTIDVEMSVYDPESLQRPWHVVHRYEKVTEPADLRIRYWSCEENNNVANQNGNTQFILPGEPGYKDPNQITQGPAAAAAPAAAGAPAAAAPTAQ